MRKTQIVELPTKLLAAALGSERRWKRVAIFGGVGAVALGGGVWFAVKTIESRRSAAREVDFASLSTCLVGEPLAAGETVEARVRAIQLGVVGTPKDKRAKPNEQPWPLACAPYAHAVSEHFGGASGPGLGASANALAVAVKSDAGAGAELAPLVAKLFADAQQKGLAHRVLGGVPAAPKPLPALLSPEAFAKAPIFLSGKFSLATVRPEPTTGKQLRFLIDDKNAPEGPLSCSWTGGAGKSVVCQKVPAVAQKSPGLTLLGTTEEGARPFFFAGERGKEGVFPPDGRDKVAAFPVVTATARADGSFFALHKAETKELKLLFVPPTGPSQDKPGLAATEVDGQHAAFALDVLVYQGPKPGGQGAHLWAKKLAPQGLAPEAAFDVGELADAAPADAKEPGISVCKSVESTVVRVTGGPTDSFAFFTGGRWSAVVKGGARGGALTCRGIDAITTSVTTELEGDRNWATVAQSKCNAGGCSEVKVPLRQMIFGLAEIAPADAKGIVAADVGGKLLVVWSAGLVGGLRMRLAPAASIKEASDVVLYDGREEGGTAGLTSFVDMKLLPLGDEALLLLSTTSGVRALRVGVDGSVGPLAVTL